MIFDFLRLDCMMQAAENGEKLKSVWKKHLAWKETSSISYENQGVNAASRNINYHIKIITSSDVFHENSLK